MTGAAASKAGGAGEMWAITAYWNPVGYRRRRVNYRIFRERLGLPLVAVEVGYGTDFELAPGDAEVLIQHRGRDVIWQKERLLNIALAALPAECTKVVWIDCDVVFASGDWRRRTSAALDALPLVQPFSVVSRMPDGWRPGKNGQPEVTRRSAPALIAGGLSLDDCLGRPATEVGCAPGYVWAARRDIIARHGLYDACVVGGGDAVLMRAAYGRIDDAVRLHLMSGARSHHYRAWAEPFAESIGGEVGFVDGELHHLWHGGSENRQYRRRLEELCRFDFDPGADIAVEDSGAWRWNSDKPEMHRYLRDYFASRREDG